jgi:hypothetical protein
LTKTPNFFIVGAPKTGTTSLARYLGSHPDIFFSDPKEPLYFCKDLEHEWRTTDLDAYLSNFATASDERLIGEGSVWYLYSEKAAEEIKAFEPDAKIIVMLRDPISLISSLHRQFLFSGNENIRSMDDALAAEEARSEGRLIPPGAHFPRGLLYTSVVRFTDQVARYIDAFGREQVHVVLFDDFRKDTRSVFRGVMRFLEVDDSYTPEFAVHNQGSQHTEVVSAVANNLLDRPPRALELAYRLIPQPVRSYGRTLISHLNSRTVRRAGISAEMASHVNAALREEFEKLSDLIGRDVVEWTR